MRITALLSFFLALQLFLTTKSIAQSVLDPKDSIVEYDVNNPPQEPVYGQIGKWVRTKSMSWNSDSYKAYIYNESCFRLKFPKSYDPTAADGKKYPIAIVFHGGGEAGPLTDNETPLYHGGLEYRNAVDKGVFDGYVLYMQSRGFWGSVSYSRIIDILNYMIINNKLDPFRISVNGLSSGGQASWDMLLNYPAYIASSLPMSYVSISYKDASVVNAVKFSPMWNFQGALDGSPAPYTAQQVRNAMVAAGGNYRYSEYADVGHNTWDSAFSESDFFPFMLRSYSSNPWTLYGKTGFCDSTAINVTIGLPPGFSKYEWRRNGVIIPNATSNSINVTQLGVYDARVLRDTIWSDFSHTPVTIQITPPTITPPIQVEGIMSNVIPDGGGKNYVNLSIPDNGYTSYTWKKVGNDSILGNQRVFTASQPGQYIISATEKFGCSSIYSQPFTIINANGLNAPPVATNLVANTISSTQVQLNWENDPRPVYNETAFEIYRSTTATGTYNFAGKVKADVLTFSDQALSPGNNYFYKIRAVNNSSASQLSNVASALTQKDSVPPTAPDSLRIVYATNSSLNIKWNSSNDNVGVSKYNIYVNGVKTYSTTDTGFILNALTTGVNYVIYVKAVDLSGNSSNQSNIANSAAVLNGLLAKYYEGNWVNMPDFTTLTPLYTTVTPNVTIASARRSSQFAYLWQGYIQIPADGTYTFQTTSDDGSMLWLNTYNPSVAPLVNNDGYRTSAQTDSGTITLSKGTYPITIAYYQTKGNKRITVSWRNPQVFGNNKMNVIEDKYFASAYITPGSAPAIPVKPAATALTYNTIKVLWTDKSNNETGFQVYRSLSAGGPYKIVYTSVSNISQYVDSGLNNSTTYFYKISAVNNFGSSSNTTAVSATTANLPAPPAAPSGLSATALSAFSIKLIWNDAATNEINYQILRSVSDTLHFKIAALLPANSNSFIDTSLYGNVAYYYKVYALSNKSSSSNLPAVGATTLNSLPVINNKITGFNIHFGTSASLTFAATDLDGDLLTFSAANLPVFAKLINNYNGSATINFNQKSNQSVTYNNLKVFVADTHGAKDSVTFRLAVNSNYTPIIDSISNYSVNEGESLTIPVVANDGNTTDSIRWNVVNAPAGYSISSINKNSANLTIAPGFTASGVYLITLKANDGNGAIDQKQFQLTVNEKDPNQTVYIRFKNADTIGVPWNNVTGATTANLKDKSGNTTSTGLNMQSGWFATSNEGPETGNNSGIYPDAVLKDYYYFGINGGPQTVANTITGLDTSKLYSVSFYGGSNYSQVADNGTTIYTIGTQSKALSVQNNISNTADFTGIKPALNGTIAFTLSKGANTSAGYLNAIVIKRLFQDSTKPADPTDLAAENISGKGVKLTWTDNAYNEAGYQVVRAVKFVDKFTVVGTLDFNATTFFDTTVAGKTQYFYRVRALNAQGVSNNSNTATITTLDRIPTLNAIQDVTLQNDQQKTINVIASDDATDHITFSVKNLPSFVTFTDNGNNSGFFSIQPSNGIMGTFNNVILTAKDNSDSSTSVSFNITITDKNVNSVYINFTNSATLAPGFWNNFISYPTSGSGIYNLINDNNFVTTLSLKLLNGFQGQSSTGMQSQDGQNIYPDAIMRTGEYETADKTDSILVSGLSSSKKYNFVFFNSHDDGSNGNTNFEINGQVVSLNAMHNVNKTVQINGITADINGQAIIKVSKATTADNAYINSLIIQIYDKTQTIFSPSDLKAVNITRNSVSLQWADRSFGETGFEVWRASDSSGVYSLINTTPANITSYTDSNLSSNKTYYYSVRTVKGATFSDFSNPAPATTYGQAIYVNFAFTNTAKAPWNNTQALPTNGDEWDNLFDDSGVPSSVNMQIAGNFAGLHSAGINTGNNSGIYPDNVLIDSYGLFAGQTSSIKISGLNLAKKYDFTFFASSQATGDVNTAYIVNGKKVILNAALNINGTVTIHNVVPDENGEVSISLLPATSSSQLGLIGALVIQEYTASTNSVPSPSQVSGKVLIASSKPGSGENLVTKQLSSNIGNLTAYPNPFQNSFNLSFNLEGKDDIMVQLFDIKGVPVYQKKFSNLLAGYNSINIKTNQDLTSGIYIAKIILSGGQSKALRLVRE